jgi:hypothetical protein
MKKFIELKNVGPELGDKIIVSGQDFEEYSESEIEAPIENVKVTFDVGQREFVESCEVLQFLDGRLGLSKEEFYSKAT